MIISTFPAGFLDTNAYLLTEPDRGEAILIDAPHDVFPEVEATLAAEKCRLTALLITHGHWDHTGDAARIKRMGVPVYAHQADRALIETPEVMLALTPPGISLEPVAIDHFVDEGSVLKLLGQTIEVRHVPGHCPGNVLFYFPTEKSAFVGDALFAGSVGRADLPGGNFQALVSSIRNRIYTLPEETVIYPGHGPATTVGEEARNNPFVRKI